MKSSSLAIAALIVLAGCGIAPAAAPDLDLTPLTPEEQALVDAIGDVSTASQESFNASVAEVPTEETPEEAAYRVLTVESPLPVQGTDFYEGPFPAASSLPGDWKVRKAGGWLKVNPSSRSLGVGIDVTSTYWTPDGAATASAAQTIKARLGDKTIQDLYVSPNTPVADLPAFFKSRLTLPATYEVLQAEETYQVYQNGSLAGPARGYRWLVKDGDAQSWARGLQVRLKGGATVNHFNVSSSYALLNGTMTPLHTAYGTQVGGAGCGYGFVRDTDPDTGETVGDGVWSDLRSGARIAIHETIASDGACDRTLTRTLKLGEALELQEHYGASDRAGTGTVLVNGHAVGTLSWNNRYVGRLKLGKAVAGYTPSRKSAAQRPSSLNIEMRPAIVGFNGHPM